MVTDQNQLTFDAILNFRQNVPYHTYCSGTKMIRYFLPKEKALQFPYIKVNFPHINYLVYDLDYPSAPTAPEDNDLPGPTLTVITPDSGHAHLLYELHDPIPLKQSAATKALLRLVLFGYRELLCADKVITTQKQLVKNAISDEWDVITGYKPFTLYELAESIPANLRQQRRYNPMAKQLLRVKPFSETLNPDSRNCSLFDNARFYAYTVATNYLTYDDLYGDVLLYLERLNDVEILSYFPKKVRTSELRSIAKSITGWTYERRHQFKPNRGAMGFEAMAGVYWEPEKYTKEVRRRRKLSASRTNEMRTEATRQKIVKAIELCLKAGHPVTGANIAKYTGVSRKTLYNHNFREIIKSV